MADPDVNELRALRRRAQAALARAEAAVAEVRDLQTLMDAPLDRLVKRAEGRDDDTEPRDRSGGLQKRYRKVILTEGGAQEGVWIDFEQITAAMPDVTPKALRRSLDSGTERLVEVKGNAFRLLENGMKLAALA